MTSFDQPLAALPATREELRASLAKVEGLTPALVDHLTRQAAPAIRLATKPEDDSGIPLGASKFGGAPDLPATMVWPERLPYPDAEERREFHRILIAQTLSKAGLAPDWMTPEDGAKFVREMQQAWRKGIDAALKTMSPEEAAIMRPIMEANIVYTPEQAHREAADNVLKARLLYESLPLSFITQLDLGALSKEDGFDPDLPGHGRFLFFYDLLETPAGFQPGSRAGFRLIWDETLAADLHRGAVPDKLAAIHVFEKLVLDPARIAPRSVVAPITPFDENWDAIRPNPDPSQDSGKGPFWAYSDWLSAFGTPDASGNHGHQLGGWPQPIQPGMQAMAALSSNGLPAGRPEDYDAPNARTLLETAKNWKLVLQIGVDETVGLTAGAYYVLMDRDDLLARRFDRAWVVYQAD